MSIPTASNTWFLSPTSHTLPFVIVESRTDWGTTLERAELQYVSKSGAVVRFSTLMPLPEEIKIYFPDDGLPRTALVRWRDGRSFGIELDQSNALPERWLGGDHRAARPVVIKGGNGAVARLISRALSAMRGGTSSSLHL